MPASGENWYQPLLRHTRTHNICYNVLKMENMCWRFQQHQQNVKWFGRHNWTTRQLWTATPILPGVPRCSQMVWMQCRVLFTCSKTTSLVLLNSPAVLKHSSRISWRVYSCQHIATKSNYSDVQILQALELLTKSLRQSWISLNR